MSRLPLIFGLAMLASAGLSAEYTFTPLPETGTGKVSVRLKKPLTEFRMPAWAPGDYEIFNYGKYVESMEFFLQGQKAAVERTADPNLWRIPLGADQAAYTIKPSRGNFSVNLRVTSDHAFVSGPGVLGWFEGDQKSKQTLRLRFKPGDKIETTLDRLADEPPDLAIFEAFDYDELIDAPFVMGAAVKTESFQVHGKTLSVVGFNRIENADLSGFVKVGRAAAESAHALFGELPFPRYIFFCDFGGGGGGLEHLNSTRLGLPARAQGQYMGGFVFHEFFHLYNVKRIREKPLGPFDYTKPAVAHTIWWLEGTTDYYADILQYRAGLQTREAVVGELGSALASFAQNPNRLKVSAQEASLKVWETRGSFGYGGISYYDKGKLIGICLDLAIRGHSQGRHSLDNVMVDLYEECKNRKPGYAPGRIRELCVKYGGPALGPIYDVCAEKAADLPVSQVAKSAGLEWTGRGFAPDPLATSAQRAVGAQWPGPVK